MTWLDPRAWLVVIAATVGGLAGGWYFNGTPMARARRSSPRTRRSSRYRSRARRGRTPDCGSIGDCVFSATVVSAMFLSNANAPRSTLAGSC